MADWFKFNGTKCTAYGIHVEEQPAIPYPEGRAEFVDIPGRSGSLTETEGDDVFNDITLTVKCLIGTTSESNLREIGRWLTGSGKLVLPYRDGYYNATVVEGMSLEKVAAANSVREFDISFRCKPYLNIEADDIELTASGSVTNPYSFDALPSITIYGSGENQTVMIGTHSLLIDSLTDYITIDCDAMMAFRDSVNYSSHVTLVNNVWPSLVSGTNLVTISSGITEVVITPNWRTL